MNNQIKAIGNVIYGGHRPLWLPVLLAFMAIGIMGWIKYVWIPFACLALIYPIRFFKRSNKNVLAYFKLFVLFICCVLVFLQQFSELEHRSIIYLPGTLFFTYVCAVFFERLALIKLSSEKNQFSRFFNGSYERFSIAFFISIAIWWYIPFLWRTVFAPWEIAAFVYAPMLIYGLRFKLRNDRSAWDYTKLVVLFIGFFIFLARDMSSQWDHDLFSFLSGLFVIVYFVIALYHRIVLRNMKTTTNIFFFAILLLSVFFITYTYVQLNLADQREERWRYDLRKIQEENHRLDSDLSECQSGSGK